MNNLNDLCSKSVIELSSDIPSKIYSTPENVLKDINGFWEKELPYKLTLEWGKFSAIKVELKEFEEIIKDIEKQSIEQRKKSKVLEFSRQIELQFKKYKTKGLSHLIGYLPNDVKPIKSTIYLAPFIPPYAFAWGDGSIIINVAAKKWNNDVDDVLNLLVHEAYHVGFRQFQLGKDIDEASNDKQILENITWHLQNEGMATYVAYKALEIFSPKLKNEDYIQLENLESVKELVKELNSLIAESDKNKGEKVKKLIWDKGVANRSFYVVGAYMAKVIENKFGKEKLLGLIQRGPEDYIAQYNKIVIDELKITFP